MVLELTGEQEHEQKEVESQDHRCICVVTLMCVSSMDHSTLRAVAVFARMITASRPRNRRCFMSGQMLQFHLERIWENERKLTSFVHYFLICKGLSDLFSHLIQIYADICLTLVLWVPHGSAETCTSAVSGGAGMQPSDPSHLVWPLASPDRETTAHRGKIIFTGL